MKSRRRRYEEKMRSKNSGFPFISRGTGICTTGSFLGNMQGIKAVQAEETDDWAIYWYLCGSDLESNYGSATEDLSELMEAELPENVKNCYRNRRKQPVAE